MPLMKYFAKKEDIKDSKFKRQVDEYLEIQAKLKEEDKDHYDIRLCLPGSIVQLFRTEDNLNESGEAMGRHVARWAKRSDFEHIELSPRFLLDHQTSGVTDNIRKLAEESFELSNLFSPLNG
mmetsp:Transcript_71/g.165  ORF Transcript_71/g.165 Transcript_71/m.165 type:complete len:122 (+) Transcript_71:2130-2495(+)